MTVEWIIGLVGGLLALIFGGVGWSQIRKHGRSLEQRDQAERERDAANEDADTAARPPLSGPESVDALRRLRD